MANPLEMLGVGNNGLGSAVMGLQALEAQDMQRQLSLADLAAKQQLMNSNALGMQKEQLALEEARQLSPSKIAAGIAGNEASVGDAQLKKQQQFGQMVSQMGRAFENIPPEQRMQYLQAMGQKVPGITEDPTFQSLLSTSPEQLPLALRQVGNDIMLRTGEQLRALELQKAKDDASMAREQVGQAGATGRQAMSDAAAMERAKFNAEQNRLLEQTRIDAGKYDKDALKRDPNYIVSTSKNFQEASTKLYLAAESAKSPEEKQNLQNMAALMEQRAKAQAAAGARPGMTIDSFGNLVPNDVYGVSTPPIGGAAPQGPQVKSQQGAVPQGLPQGTINNGDGTFTLPDGRKVRRKQ